MMRTLVLLHLFVSTVTLGQSTSDVDESKAYARSPKEIVFQNDSQWEDNRWQRTDVGPFLSGTIAAALCGFFWPTSWESPKVGLN